MKQYFPLQGSGYGSLPRIVSLSLTAAQDDGIIPPSHTRRVLGLGLMAALGGKNEAAETKFGVFRM